MSKVGVLIKKYLRLGRMMQVATVSVDQPWVCTVYFVKDKDLNLYWLSLPYRRHSQEIEKNNRVAITVPVKFDKNPIIGIQAEGTASVVNDADEVAKIMKLYTEKYDLSEDFYDNFIAGKNQHLLYKFTPKTYYLFDEVNFPEGEKHAWSPGGNT